MIAARFPSRSCAAAWALSLVIASVVAPACKPAARSTAPAPANDLDLPPALASSSPDTDDATAPEGGDTARPVGATSQAPATLPAGSRRGTIERTTLDAVLDRGPGSFLGGFEVAPHFRSQRFAGWAIVRFLESGRVLSSVDLRPGDVVMTVNGYTIARPRHLQELWLELRISQAIVVKAEREGQPFELRFDVIDSPGTPAP
jgi:S1-C subfamily serine protease